MSYYYEKAFLFGPGSFFPPNPTDQTTKLRIQALTVEFSISS